MNRIRELDQIVLTRDLPEFGLCAEDVGTVVLIYRSGEGYEVEFMTLDGETIVVTTLRNYLKTRSRHQRRYQMRAHASCNSAR
jgi:hypothetical protein